jgi:tyrosine-protein kinase Etk/Wzc
MNTNYPQDMQSRGQSGSQFYDARQESPLLEYAGLLLRGKWIIIISLIVVGGLSAVYTLKKQPVYEASTMVLIDMKEKDGVMRVYDMNSAMIASRITNELEIMKSNAISEALAEALLAKRTVDSQSSSLLNIIKTEKKDQSGDTLASEATIIMRLAGAIEFSHVKESDIIRITVRSVDPKEAALIADMFTEVYTSQNLNNSRVRSHAMREFLQSQMQAKRQTLDTTENDLQTYMRKSGVVSLDAEANKVVEQMSQLEAQRDGLEVEKSTVQKNLESYKQELARQEPNAAKAMGESNDSYIKLLQEQLAKLEVQRDVTIAQNPELVGQKLYSEKLTEINGQISEFKKRLSERTHIFLNSLLPGEQNSSSGGATFLAQIKQKIIEQQIELGSIGARLSALNGVIAEYDNRFNQIPRKSIDLAKLQRARLSSEKLYLLVEEKFNEAAISEKSEFGNVSVIDHAKVPQNPVSPNVPRNLILGFFMGLGIGVGIVFVRSFMNRSIMTPEDLKRNGYIPLSSISHMNGDAAQKDPAKPQYARLLTLDRHLVAHYRPLSPISESYRRLRGNVQCVLVDTPLHCMVVTSANPKEGKTTTTCNLAISFAQTEMKVLLVDADMRRPTVHTVFGLPNLGGLNEHLFGKASVDQVTRKGVLPNLDIITCGMTPPNPAELLGSKRMKEFIAQMQERYDLVIFDSPPILAVTDAGTLGAEANGVLLVVAAGQTQMAGLDRAADYILSLGVKLLGVVLNKFDPRRAYGAYYSSHHYGYYGYESGYYGEDGKKKARADSKSKIIK